jgi:GNAT superfamily N-acetyltransferase
VLKVIGIEAQHVFEWAQLAKDFINEALQEYNWGVNEDDLHTTYHSWNKDFGFLLQDEGKIVGCLCGIVTPHFFDYENKFFSEFMWYVKPEYRNKGGGLLLFRECQRKCIEAGVTRMVMGHTKYMKEEFENLYTKLGFTYLQTHYEKIL